MIHKSSPKFDRPERRFIRICNLVCRDLALFDGVRDFVYARRRRRISYHYCINPYFRMESEKRLPKSGSVRDHV